MSSLIVGGLTLRDDGPPGWVVEPLPAGLTPVGADWSSPGARRTVIWNHDATPIIQLDIAVDAPDQVTAHASAPGAAVTLTDINGHPAVATELDGTASVAWVRGPGVTVRVAVRSKLDTAFLIARTVTSVDQATWEATSIPGSDDGCAGLFC